VLGTTTRPLTNQQLECFMADANVTAIAERETICFPGEVWMPVAGFEGRYEVSSLGRIKRLETALATWFGRRIAKTCILAPQVHAKTGYVNVALQLDRTIKHTTVHAVVLEAFSGPRPAGLQARHINGIRTDNRAANLQWGTRLENMRDQYIHGTRIQGDSHPKSKITPEIFDLVVTSRLSGAELARQLKLGTSTISRIRRGVSKVTLLGITPSA